MASAKRQPGEVEPNEDEAQRIAHILLTGTRSPRDFPDEVMRIVRLAHHDKSEAYAKAMAERVRRIIEWAVPTPDRQA